MIKSLSVLIPAYNEENTIHEILKAVNQVVLNHNVTLQIVVVNDCSTDNTKAKVEEFIQAHPEVPILFQSHEKNQGKGAAIHTAISLATGDYCIVQDADLEYTPEEFNDLLVPIIKANADAVYGSRFMGSNPHRILFFWHTIGNKFLTLLSNMMTNLNLTDMETCYKMVRTSILKSLTLKEKRFGFEPELTAKLAKVKDIKIYEVGVSYYGRTYAEGKKIGWRDGFRAIYCIIKYKFFS